MKNAVISLLLFGASVSVAVGQEMKPKRFLSPRDAMPVEGIFMNGVMMAKAKVKRDDLQLPSYYADPPAGVGLGGRGSLEARQWGCETVGQINCVFKGCCDQGTICGTYGGEQGCCPVGKTCSGVGSCKATEITCGSGCCPAGAKCTVDSDGSDACDYSGASSSVGVNSATTSSRAPSSTSTSDSSCPSNYSPCSGTEYCCPAGVKCLPNLKCDTTCEDTDPICGAGCCKPGFACDSLTSTCFQDGDSGSGGSSSRATSSRATPSSSRLSNSPSSPTTTSSGSGNSGSDSGSNSGSNSGSGTNGLGTSSGASNLVVSMGITILFGVLGIAML